MSGTNDDVSITVGASQIAGWETVTITRSAEMFPNYFSFSMTEEFSQDPNTILAIPGKGICQVKIGSDLVVTGYVDRYTTSIDAHSHNVEITGRGLCEDLADCSVDITNESSPFYNGAVAVESAIDLAEKLAATSKLNARIAVSDRGPPIPKLLVAPGETSYELLEKVCRYAGYLIYEDETGTVVLDRAGTAKMASGFAQGVNVEAATSSLSVEQRFTTYTIMASTVDQATEGAKVDVSNKRATAKDDALIAMGRVRPRIIISQQTDGNADFADRMVKWEMARRNGRSQSVQLTCDSWRDSAGKLWQPNRLAPVNLPALKVVNAEWLIATVVFRKDQGGTHADIQLMPPDAFSIEPTTLTLFDRELDAKAPAALDGVS
jgi:prophage tail gpP-like protein